MLEQLKELALAFPTDSWTFIGFILILYELIFWRKRILIFAGVSALTISVITNYNIATIPDFFTQFVAFGIMTIVWAIILWLPIHIKDKMRRRNRHLIGKTGKLLRTLKRGKTASIQVGDEAYHARMQPDSVLCEIAANEIVRITRTMGGTLFVEPTSIPRPSEKELQKYRDHIAKNPLMKDW
jgi:membrane protein implicated in regulation of membrane protease activity